LLIVRRQTARCRLPDAERTRHGCERSACLRGAIEKLRRDGIEIFLTAVRPQPMKVMFEAGLAERIGPRSFLR
jgi:hypothetical protein